MFDVVIIGAGPAGLSTAYSLLKNLPELKVALFEAGSIRDKSICSLPIESQCRKCKNCETITGLGGCFLPFHASKLSFPPSGKRLAKFLGEDEYQRICEIIWSLYCELIKTPNLPYPKLAENINLLENSLLSFQNNLSLIKYPIHISTEEEHLLFINEIYQILLRCIEVFPNKFIDITHDVDLGNRTLKICNDNTIKFKDIFIATGRLGFSQTQQFFKINRIPKKEENINFGIRYMVPSKYLNIISELHPDFKLNLQTPEAKFETFCFSNSHNGGRVDFLRYDEFLNIDGHICINTEGDKKNNIIYGNFAVLYENCQKNISYKEIVSRIDKMATNNFKRVPIEYSLFVTNKSELSQFFTELELNGIIKFSMDIFKFIATLNKIEIDYLLNKVYVYGPEIENIWGEVKVMDASFRIAENVFAIGDCTGLAQGVISSMTMGYKAGEMYKHK
jgi:uncharacterized FAD-dependent dehydrogenase